MTARPPQLGLGRSAQDAEHRLRLGERSERTNAAVVAISEAAAAKERLIWG